MTATARVDSHLVWIVSNSAAALLSIAMFVTIAGRFGRNLRRLARMEPGRRRKVPPRGVEPLPSP